MKLFNTLLPSLALTALLGTTAAQAETVAADYGQTHQLVVALPVVFAPPAVRPQSNVATLAPASRAEPQPIQVRKRA